MGKEARLGRKSQETHEKKFPLDSDSETEASINMDLDDVEVIQRMSHVREYVPEGSTTVFDAPQRKGKTLAGVLWGLDAWQNGRTFFPSMPVGFPHEPLEFTEIDLEDAENNRRFWNGHIYVDELNFYFDARRSMSKDNRKFGTFLLQQKKQGCNLTGSTHNINYLDLRIRQNHDYLIHPEVFPPYPEVPQVLIMRIEGGPLVGAFYKKIALEIKPVFLELYDSFQVYNPFKNLDETPRAKRPVGRPRKVVTEEEKEPYRARPDMDRPRSRVKLEIPPGE